MAKRMSLNDAVGADMRKLSRDVLAFDKALRKAASDTVRDGVPKTVGLLAEATPVDTSKAASNWVASVGFPKSNSIEAHVKGKAGSTHQASIQAAVDAARDAVKNKKPGQALFITNNVPYMQKLAEEGHSTQQPNPGWIEAVANISQDQWQMRLPVIGT